MKGSLQESRVDLGLLTVPGTVGSGRTGSGGVSRDDDLLLLLHNLPHRAMRWLTAALRDWKTSKESTGRSSGSATALRCP